MEENRFKKTERTLYDYKGLEAKIKNIEIDINNLENDITLKAISYDEKTSPTNAFNSSVENEVIKRDEFTSKQIDTLKAKKVYYQNLKIKIENAISVLDEVERAIIELKYFDTNNLHWSEISAKVGLERNWCMRKRNQIINKLTDIIYP
mgnify:CR=1 FL=1